MFFAGFKGSLCERIASEPASAFAGPHGYAVALQPDSYGFTADYAQLLLKAALRWLRKQPEEDDVSVLLIFLPDAGCELPDAFKDEFFPFAYGRAVEPISLTVASNPQQIRTQQNKYVENLKSLSVQMRQATAALDKVLAATNNCPYLLPIKNFQSNDLTQLLVVLENALHLGASGLQQQAKSIATPFLARYQTTNPRAGRHPKEKCFSDGKLLFRNPRRARHARLHFTEDSGHEPKCFFAARSRIGGIYDAFFHFDCDPVHTLNKSYPSCHGNPVVSARQYLNIAPNDFVR